jgi:hypothetical protein
MLICSPVLMCYRFVTLPSAYLRVAIASVVCNPSLQVAVTTACAMPLNISVRGVEVRMMFFIVVYCDVDLRSLERGKAITHVLPSVNRKSSKTLLFLFRPFQAKLNRPVSQGLTVTADPFGRGLVAHPAVDDEVSKPFKLGFLVGFGCCVVAILHFKRCWMALVWFWVWS